MSGVPPLTVMRSFSSSATQYRNTRAVIPRYRLDWHHPGMFVNNNSPESTYLYTCFIPYPFTRLFLAAVVATSPCLQLATLDPKLLLGGH